MKPAAPVTKTRIGCFLEPKGPYPKSRESRSHAAVPLSIAQGAAEGRFPPRLTLPEALVIEQPDQPKPFAALSYPTRAFRGQNMANTKSAKKATRQATRRTAVNKARRTRLRSSVRKVEEAIASGNKAAAAAALKEAEPVIARAARKGVAHRRTASRKVSRLAKRVGAMGAR